MFSNFERVVHADSSSESQHPRFVAILLRRATSRSTLSLVVSVVAKVLPDALVRVVCLVARVDSELSSRIYAGAFGRAFP
eukprot:scaffold131018_cov29-Attheya_sp.AAC.2